MARIELTIAQNYVNWGLWEGLRELVQNGLDAQTDGHKFSITYSKENRNIVLITEGVTLATKTLLVGYSTKRDRKDMLGQYGEGYKLGLLALVNKGHPVQVYTGNEVWTPRVEPSKQFGGVPVLVINTDINRLKLDGNTLIVINNISQKDWDEQRAKFLCFDEPKNVIKTRLGSILCDPRYVGHIYIGGIFVQKVEKLVYGYNFAPNVVGVDRDRRMVNRSDVNWVTASMWQVALLTGSVDIKKVTHLLTHPDATDGDSLAAMWGDHRTKIAEDFLANNPGAIPVSTSEEKTKLEFFGKTAVVVGPKMLGAMGDKVPRFADILKQAAEAPSDPIPEQDLTQLERDSLYAAFNRMTQVTAISRSDIDIVTFKNGGFDGMYKAGRILLSRHVLQSAKGTLKTMVHEYAHMLSKAADGKIDHVQALEEVWSDLAG
jgi:hypothetical protein